MSVTLDVSKLSGWLNAGDHCRVEGKACGAGAGGGCGLGGGRVWGGGGAGGMHWEGPTQGLGARARAEERTENMECMSVTWDVSKLSS